MLDSTVLQCVAEKGEPLPNSTNSTDSLLGKGSPLAGDSCVCVVTSILLLIQT